MTTRIRRCRRAFTLIELLVVIAIIAILIGRCCPRSRRSARRPTNLVRNNLSRSAGHPQPARHVRPVPPAATYNGLTARPTKPADLFNGAFGNPFFQLLLFVEQENLYKRSVVTTPVHPHQRLVRYTLSTDATPSRSS